MELKWLGHASWKIKTGGKTIYIDPYEGEYDEKADLVLSTQYPSQVIGPGHYVIRTGNIIDNALP